MSRVVIINGYPRAGKDTFVELCNQWFHPCKSVWTSTPAKKQLADEGWDHTKSQQARKILSDLVNKGYKDGTVVTHIMEEVDNLPDHGVAFIHVREPHNIRYFQQVFKDAVTILIDQDVATDHIQNDSDKNVKQDMSLYDHVIENNKGMDELMKKAHAFIYAGVIYKDYHKGGKRK